MTVTPEFSEYNPAPIVRTTPTQEAPVMPDEIEDTKEYKQLSMTVDILLKQRDTNPLLMVRALNELAVEMTFYCVNALL